MAAPPEKNGKVNEMPCHHDLEAHLDAYIEAAGIGADRKGPLFRAALGKTGKLSEKPLSRTDVWYMIRRRAADAGIETKIGCHTFRATGINDYLSNGCKLEVAQRMAGHANAKPLVSTTGATMTSASVRWNGWGFEILRSMHPVTDIHAMKRCEMLVTTIDRQEKAGTFYLENGAVTMDVTPGYEVLMSNVANEPTTTDGRQSYRADEQTAQWFIALPTTYTGSYLRANMLD